MSGIFKSLQPKDVRVVPYQAYKKISSDIDANGIGIEEPSFRVYDAIYSTQSSHPFIVQGQTSIDAGTQEAIDLFDFDPASGDNGGYWPSALLKQTDKLFYRNYLSHYYKTPGGGNINYNYRVMGSQVKIISMPTKRVGEGIFPTSVVIGTGAGDLVDDGYGNLRVASAVDPADFDNLMSSYHFGQYYRYMGEGNVVDIQQSLTYGSDRLFASFSNVSFVEGPSTGMVGVKFANHESSSLNLTAYESSIARSRYNFVGKDFAIAFGVKASGNGVILAKQRPTLDWGIDPAGNVFTNTRAPGNFPYKITCNGGSIQFQKSDGSTTFSIGGGGIGNYANVVLQRSGSEVELYVNGALVGSDTDSFVVAGPGNPACQLNDINCANDSNIIVGNSHDGLEPLDGSLYYLHFFNRHLTPEEIDDLNVTDGIINGFAGNIFYNLGIAVVTHPAAIDGGIDSVEYRSTMTLLETQAYCTVGPGEYQTTFNRSVHTWDPVSNQYVVSCRYTGSEFRPYVTSVGLYNDNNELLAVAKLSTPIQTSKTTDTTFVVRFDR